MTKTIKLSDVQSLNGKTNWLYLKKSNESSKPSQIAPEIRQHHLNQNEKTEVIGHLTNCLRVIRNAWHSYSIAGLYVYGGMIRFRGCVVHPLTGC
ncbi:hypothetical protein [Vibrio harveyi]|nr:hypothetical protein [Vibrio harveyi]